MQNENIREIPYNYTSADDARIVKLLLGVEAWNALEKMRFQRKTGRLARLLMRFLGDLFILQRNPFVYQKLLESKRRRQHFLKELEDNLDVIEKNSAHTLEAEKIITICREKLKKMREDFASKISKQRKIKSALGDIIGRNNIFFDPFTIISHATDATGWRMCLPIAVIRPSEESQVAPLLTAIENLGLKVIPRGAGTGLTGGCVPVQTDCVIINTEKLNKIRGIKNKTLSISDSQKENALVLEVEAGVITQDAISYAEKRGGVFATDPTSAWACTIGGNIAENAGGKKAVLWGTAIDNILSFRVVMPGGKELFVKRVDHPLRKIYVDDTVQFDVHNWNGSKIKTITLEGSEIRKRGLGKDITNKALNGLPGIQKEGTDGIITSAEFILHKTHEYKATCCLEFFGQDMDEAGNVILELSQAFRSNEEEALAALEHFDEEYVRAIAYKVKAPTGELPKAVLLIDIVGHSTKQIEKGKKRLTELLENYSNTYIFFARDQEEANLYWQDRKRLGAIASRTNSFKLNEDIVLPLPALSEFAEFVDRYNIEEQRENQRSFVWQTLNYLEEIESKEDKGIMGAKLLKAKKLANNTLEEISLSGKEKLQEETHIRELTDNLFDFFQGYENITDEVARIYKEVRSTLIVTATHMHAGDGNVHVNIPVFPNDREMMIMAGETADEVMSKAVELGGVVSGEHGIGFTKLTYIEPEKLEALAEYRKEVDPSGIMNPGKLSDMNVPDRIFAQSFNLLGLEAKILNHNSLLELANRISKCIRCGKCKADCCVFYPAANLFFHPRNKNLALSSLIEAILYDAQRFRSSSFRFLEYLEEIADHCTICHKCADPCPVDIDTGVISIEERNILVDQKQKHTPLATRMVLGYLDSRSVMYNSFFKRVILQWGGRFQRIGSRLLSLVPVYPEKKKGSLLSLFESPVTPISPGTLRDILPQCREDQALFIRPPGKTKKTVFYFPGCGSERIFSVISKASLYILLKSGAAVLLPPPFLCCGYPASVNAHKCPEKKEVMRSRIVFSQIREMFGYLSFGSCIISCGTCREALIDQDIENIFHTKVTDVSKFVLEAGITLNGVGNYLYHRPCHDSLEGQVKTILGGDSKIRLGSIVEHCCSEAGTLAISRPDIAAAMRKRKKDAIRTCSRNVETDKVVLTNCPACLQGIGRFRSMGIESRHIAEEIATSAGGEEWIMELKNMVTSAEVITF
jgi:FAD/FMN-containing dehydrogenase/Fe-S oxidoreductase